MKNNSKIAVMLGLFLVCVGCGNPTHPQGTSSTSASSTSTWQFTAVSYSGPTCSGTMSLTETPPSAGATAASITGQVLASNCECIGGTSISGPLDIYDNTLLLDFDNVGEDGGNVIYASVGATANSAFTSMTGSYGLTCSGTQPGEPEYMGTWTATSN